MFSLYYRKLCLQGLESWFCKDLGSHFQQLHKNLDTVAHDFNLGVMEDSYRRISAF